MTVEAALQYLESQHNALIERLRDFIRIPSVSAQKSHAEDMHCCADFLMKTLTDMGLQPRKMPTGGWDVIYAEWLEAGPEAPTILIYGHYDVQPPEPLEPWTRQPFDAEIDEGRIWGRGSADDKGQIWTHIAALEAYFRTAGRLPVNIKILIEGEEEIGSDNLPGFVQQHAEMLKADAVLISDTSQFAPGMPAITYGLRGLCYLEVRVQGAKMDLHSGGYGGAVPNPIHALAEMLAALHDADNRVTVPGFYDDVTPLQDWEREAWSKLPFDEAEYIKMLGIQKLQGEQGFSTLERLWARPTLEINGIFGGYAGPGAKTVLPCWAGAKISCRLVPNQKSADISKKLENHLRALAPETVSMTVEHMAGGEPSAFPTDHPWIKAGERAISKGFGREPVYTRLGGSIPIVQLFSETLGTPVVLLGYCHPDCGAHGPDEFFGIDEFTAGARSNVFMLDEAAHIPSV